MTHTDSVARDKIIGWTCPRCSRIWGPTFYACTACNSKIPPSTPQPEAKPEGLKWGCEIEGQDGNVYVYHGSHDTTLAWLTKDGTWTKSTNNAEETLYFADKPTALSALNACTQPPPDWQPHSSVTSPSTSHDNAAKVGDAKPEAGEQRVLPCPFCKCKPGASHLPPCPYRPFTPTPQPAEPKVMPDPSPPSKTQGVEWLPSGMETAYSMGAIVQNKGLNLTREAFAIRDTQWRSFIESERAQHKAEMEAVKKEMSR